MGGLKDRVLRIAQIEGQIKVLKAERLLLLNSLLGEEPPAAESAEDRLLKRCADE